MDLKYYEPINDFMALLKDISFENYEKFKPDLAYNDLCHFYEVYRAGYKEFERNVRLLGLAGKDSHDKISTETKLIILELAEEIRSYDKGYNPEIVIEGEYFQDVDETSSPGYWYVEILKLKVNYCKAIIALVEAQKQPSEVINAKEEQEELPLIDLSSLKDQIRLMYEMKIIDFIKREYKIESNNALSIYISKILRQNRTTVQPYINALLNSNTKDKNYPELNKGVESIMTSLKSKT